MVRSRVLALVCCVAVDAFSPREGARRVRGPGPARSIDGSELPDETWSIGGPGPPGDVGEDLDELFDSGIDYKKDASGRVTPASMTVGKGMAMKDVIAPELWADFGLDPETGEPVGE
mmetsp:Transcript_9400/g.29301  ORF Transcript_9400/g.29301 Transcript_9400/m.29301 type:complete len:117 (-) Transcript_9400:25-375(-)